MAGSQETYTTTTGWQKVKKHTTETHRQDAKNTPRLGDRKLRNAPPRPDDREHRHTQKTGLQKTKKHIT
jgi:hypothetical protein